MSETLVWSSLVFPGETFMKAAQRFAVTREIEWLIKQGEFRFDGGVNRYRISMDGPRWLVHRLEKGDILALEEDVELLIRQRDELMLALRNVMTSLSQSDRIPPIVIKDLRNMLQEINQRMNLP